MYLPKPELTSDSKFRAYGGDNLTLFCSFSKPDEPILSPGLHFRENKTEKFGLRFELNGTVLETDNRHNVVKMEEYVNNKLSAQINLTVFNLDRSRDEGEYKCIVEDEYGNLNYVEKHLSFINEVFVNLEPETSVITVRSDIKDVTFRINFISSYSTTTTTIMIMKNLNNEKISNGHDIFNRTKYDVKIQDGKVELTIKQPDINDFGNYTILATSVGKKFSTSVMLIVKTKPVVTVKDVYVVKGQPINVTCKVTGYPASIVSWSKYKSDKTIYLCLINFINF